MPEQNLPEVTLGETTEATDPTSATAVVTEEEQTPVSQEPKYGFWWGLGRRKSSVARVRIRPGKGHFLINGRKIDEFFTKAQDRNDMMAPLEVAKVKGNLDVYVRVNGGGTTGQAGAILLGLSRALKNYDGALEASLREKNFLTRDAREVERKKYGQRGARRRFQFSKR